MTPGLISLHYEGVACSGGGFVTPYMFYDSACGNVDELLQFDDIGGGCVSEPSDKTAAAIMLSCNRDGPGQAETTSTIPIAEVATGAPPKATSSSNSGSGGDSGDSSGSGSSSGSENQSDDKKTGWNSLSKGAQIGIIVASAIAGLGLTLTLTCTCYCCNR